jgi:hypothetical protein
MIEVSFFIVVVVVAVVLFSNVSDVIVEVPVYFLVVEDAVIVVEHAAGINKNVFFVIDVDARVSSRYSQH